jgi:hypothetical protein
MAVRGRIGQAQGSTERVVPETDRRATDPTMEQGLEAPALFRYKAGIFARRWLSARREERKRVWGQGSR